MHQTGGLEVHEGPSRRCLEKDVGRLQVRLLLDRQIIDVLRFDQPQSVRHVFYRMTDPNLPESVEKSEKGYRHVQDRIKKLRRNGRVPYGWITDASRRGYFTNTYSDASDFLKRTKGLYRADLWQDASCY